jgi:Domain of unknown function (DUF4410)
MLVRSLIVVGVVLSQTVAAAQTKPTLVVQAFKTAPDVTLPYDLGLLQTQLVAELKVMLGQEFEVMAQTPASPSGNVYLLDGDITGWRPGNAAKRFLVGMGSGREALDLSYRVSDPKEKLFERKDTIRTNFYSQGAGSTGTLAHPIAQKIADRVKDARLR